jgi:hypothetical protein
MRIFRNRPTGYRLQDGAEREVRLDVWRPRETCEPGVPSRDVVETIDRIEPPDRSLSTAPFLCTTRVPRIRLTNESCGYERLQLDRAHSSAQGPVVIRGPVAGLLTLRRFQPGTPSPAPLRKI